MSPASNPDLLALAFIQGSVILILFVLYGVLAKGFPARFLRYWLAGWALYVGFGVSRIVFNWHGGETEYLLMQELSLGAAAFFLAALLDYTRSGRRIHWLWPVGILSETAVALEALWLGRPTAAAWTATWIESALYLAAGWALWRSIREWKGFGVALLAAALLLRGLHGFDRVEWPVQAFSLFRVSFDGLLEVTMGVAMVVLVRLADRARLQDLNDKLQRLMLITASATHSLPVEEVLGEVLHHLVESLGASHGLVRLLEGQGDEATLAVRASVGFSDPFLQLYARIPASEPWARKVLDQGRPFLAFADVIDREFRQMMRAEKLTSLVMVRVPGKETPLGLLGIGWARARVFQDIEVNFLVNVANLLGLTIQSVRLIEEVASAQRQWAFTIDSMNDLILVHDQDSRILRVNRSLAGRLGRDAGSLSGRLVRDVLHLSEARWASCPYCEGVGGKAEALDPDFSGYFLVSNSDFHDDSGVWLGTIHVLKDFTQQKEAETRFRTLFEKVQEGVFISTPEGRFLDFNDAFMRLLGYERRSDLLNREIAGNFYADPAERDRLKRLLREHGEVHGFEFQLRRRDGEVRTVLESSFATRDASGAVTAYQGFVLDVTERKQAEREIRRRNRELMVLNSIAQTLGQPLPLEDVLGRVLRQSVELLGADLAAIYLLEEGTGTVRRAAAVGYRSEYARQFSPTKVSPGLLQHIRKVHATMLSATSLPLPEVFRDLQRREGIRVSHLVVLWAKDRIVGGLAVSCRTMRDFSAAELNLLAAIGNQITTTIDKSLLLEETRQACEDLRRTQEQLLQSEKMAATGQLISGVAHELNNSLTAILGYSQLLVSGGHSSPRGVEFVPKLYKQAVRAHRIVQNLLSFARQNRPERSPVQLNQILEDTLVLREYDLKLNNIRVHREFDPDLPLTGGDTHQLQQVFLNILNNAFDAILEGGDGGNIWIRTAAVGDSLQIEFTDSGRGVQDPLRVFDPFYTTKPVGKGTGLGLSICYVIIKEHGGGIQVRNTPMRGATFTVTLPILAVSSQLRSDRASADEIPASGRVLLVDDEETVLELEQEILRGRCVAVEAVSNGREALRFLEKDEVDVVVIDTKMPGEVSGREIYHWIERHRPELANRVVFAVSDARDEEVRALAERSGCPSVQKPFQIQEFLDAVRKVIAPNATATVKR